MSGVVLIGIINTIRGIRSAYNRHQTGKVIFYIGCLVLIATAIVACIAAASSPEIAAIQTVNEYNEPISHFLQSHPIYSTIFGILLCVMLFYTVKGIIVGDRSLTRSSLILFAGSAAIIVLIVYLSLIF